MVSKIFFITRTPDGLELDDSSFLVFNWFKKSKNEFPLIEQWFKPQNLCEVKFHYDFHYKWTTNLGTKFYDKLSKFDHNFRVRWHDEALFTNSVTIKMDHDTSKGLQWGFVRDFPYKFNIKKHFILCLNNDFITAGWSTNILLPSQRRTWSWWTILSPREKLKLFGAFQKNMYMPSREKYIFQTLFILLYFPYSLSRLVI